MQLLCGRVILQLSKYINLMVSITRSLIVSKIGQKVVRTISYLLYPCFESVEHLVVTKISFFLVSNVRKKKKKFQFLLTEVLTKASEVR